MLSHFIPEPVKGNVSGETGSELEFWCGKYQRCPPLQKENVLKLFFVCDRPHTCCHRLECSVSGVGGCKADTQWAGLWRSHGSSWISAWGVCRLLCWRTTALLVWAMNSSELGKWHILGFNFAGWSPCQGYSVSQNHRISKCVLTANQKINMPSSFSWSLTENPVSQ